MKKILFIFLLLLQNPFLFSQKISLSADNISSSFRGLSVVSDDVVWVSGSKGTVGRSIDGGITWKWQIIKGFEKKDFRDIEAFDANTAVIMAVDSPAYILRTTDGGDTWKVAYRNDSKGIFLDAMNFRNNREGIVVGDPIDGRFFIASTTDSGKSWQEIPFTKRPEADSGEACFAASGTNLVVLQDSGYVFVSGGLSSHIFIHQKKILLPLILGIQTAGANSIALGDNQTIMVVGGNFLKKNDTAQVAAVSVDKGLTWLRPNSSPSGYRSCVEFLGNHTWISCGLNGVDLSHDDGMNWRKISDRSFNVIQQAKHGKAVYLAGSAGNVGKLQQ
ncbi:MAG: WD40/YVTN/BNR-like repeat-containing protein [Ginsengibacter sp.]